MHTDLAHYDALVHEIYDAALSPDRWPSVVARISAHLGAERGLLYTPFHNPAQGGFSFIHNIPPDIHQRWAASSMADDPLAQEAYARGLVVEGVSFSARELVPFERLAVSKLYKEIWEPLAIGHSGTGIVFGSSDSRTLPTAVSVYRHRDEPAYSVADLEVLRRLMAHMSRSLGVMFHLRDHELRAASNRASLEWLGAGVMLIGSAGDLQFANTSAQRLLDGHQYLRKLGDISGRPSLGVADRLRSHEKAFNSALRRALEPLNDASLEHFSNAVVLPDEEGRPGCVLHLAPLGRSLAFAAQGAEPSAIGFLYDLENAASVSPTVLAQLFGMTAAESRTALQILQGGSAAEMAGRLGISTNTFKTHLQSVYGKTHTNRGADLLKLLLALSMA